MEFPYDDEIEAMENAESPGCVVGCLVMIVSVLLFFCIMYFGR